jgi:hypothetical protein
LNWEDLQHKKAKAPYIHRSKSVGKPGSGSIESHLAKGEEGDAKLKIKNSSEPGWDVDF